MRDLDKAEEYACSMFGRMSMRAGETRAQAIEKIRVYLSCKGWGEEESTKMAREIVSAVYGETEDT